MAVTDTAPPVDDIPTQLKKRMTPNALGDPNAPVAVPDGTPAPPPPAQTTQPVPGNPQSPTPPVNSNPYDPNSGLPKPADGTLTDANWQGINNNGQPNIYDVARQTAAQSPTLSVQDFIKQYQQSHPAGGGIAPLADALKAAGYDTGRFMYGQTASNNELNIGGSKYKVLSGENGPTPGWYTAGTDDGGGNQGGGNPAMPPATSPFTDQIRKLLMERMGRDTASVNETDQNIAQPFAAANLQAQRAQQTERTALAERAAAQGDTSGSVNMGIQQSAERNAVGLGTFKGQLIAREYEARRSDLNEAMQQALASGDRETAVALQEALAQLDATLRREGYGVQLAGIQTNANAAAVPH